MKSLLHKVIALALLLAAIPAHAAISVGSCSTLVSGSSPVEATLPTHSNGDLLLVFAGASAGSGDLTLSVNESGWANRATGATTNGIDRSLLIASKVASGESGTYTVQTVAASTIEVRMCAFSGVHTDVLDQTTPTAVFAQNVNTADPPAIVTQTAGAVVVTFVVANDTPSLQPAVVPTNHTQLFQSFVGTPAILTSYRLIASPTTEDPGNWTGIDDGGATADVGSTTIALKAAATAPVLSSTSITAATNGYTIAGTCTGTGTLNVEAVACNPGDATPTADELQAGQCGGGNAAPINANENWTTGVGNDFLLTLSGAWPKYNVHFACTDGTLDSSVVSSLALLRSEDTNQDITTLTSVAATSMFAVQTVANCDTTSGSATVTGCGDTSWLQAGMRVDLSAGFADLTDVIVDEVLATSIRFESLANATSSNITVTQDPFYSPTVATSDVIEGNNLTSLGDTMTVGVDGTLSFTPAGGPVYQTWTYNIQDVSDTSDGDFDSGPPEWTTGNDLLHIFSTRPELDLPIIDTAYLFYKNVALSGVTLGCTDIDGQTFTVSARTTPTGTSVAGTGAWTGTPTVEDEAGTDYVIDCVDSGGLYATPRAATTFVTDDAITTPNLVGNTVAEAIDEMHTARAWLAPEDQLSATFAYSPTIAVGLVISQDPAAAASMTATELVDVVVSLGVQPAGGSRGNIQRLRARRTPGGMTTY